MLGHYFAVVECEIVEKKFDDKPFTQQKPYKTQKVSSHLRIGLPGHISPNSIEINLSYANFLAAESSRARDWQPGASNRDSMALC